MLASQRENQGTQAHNTTTFNNIVIHVSTNNARMKQYKITKVSQDVSVSQKDVSASINCLWAFTREV